MHMLPRVREIEERFADSLTVIGVHAGKFITERRTNRIADARDRLDVPHAVVNDRQFRVWRDYAVEAWPTLVAIDPEGYLAFFAPGETSVERLVAEIGSIVERAEARGTLVRGPDPIAPTLARHKGALRFPTRAVAAGDRLWVSDTGHGRVLECRWDARAGAATVLIEHTGIREPRGLAFANGSMHVADREGHSVYRLDATAPVRVAGTGEIGDWTMQSGDGARMELRSPWGLAQFGDRLAIAMAGSHQIWTLDPGSGALALLAGSGSEEIVDGEVTHAALAQPTGLSPAGEGTLAFADSESSAVRTADRASVGTIVGTGLFEFGDRDGTGDRVRLQHCEDVAWHEGSLVVADTYNDRLKHLDPATRHCAPWLGEAGEAGSLREPGGVSSDGVSLLVADTGHHRVVVVGQDASLIEVRFI